MNTNIIKKNTDSRLFDLYEFGVMTGGSLLEILSTCHCPRKVFGFDSFEGLPPEPNDPFNSLEWTPGMFSSDKYFNTTPDNAMKMVQDRISVCHSDIILIKGFYCDSLKDDIVLRHDMKPAQLVNIDVDIYTSCYEALDFMCRNNLVVPGTIIRYDDWGGSLMNAPEFMTGESRAHKEILEKYSLTATCLYKYGSPPHIEAIYQINSTVDYMPV